MQKDLNKALRARFTERLAHNVGNFSLVKRRSPLGRTAFLKPVGPAGCNLFLILYPDTKRDAFTIEIGWTKAVPFQECFKLSWPTPTRIEFQEPDFACRLGSLFAGKDFWWYVRPDYNPFTDELVPLLKERLQPITSAEAIRLVTPLVDDAVQKLLSHGIPYLNEYLVAVGAPPV